jgi:hypothetical protein
MFGMRGFTGVAGQRALSTGILLIAGGGLALYQMTSLVLGPAGARQLHLSLTIPAADPDEGGQSWGTASSLLLGTLAPASTAAPVRAASTTAHKASAIPVARPAAAPVAPVAPVAPQPPVRQPVPVSKPSLHQDQDQERKAGVQKNDDTD